MKITLSILMASAALALAGDDLISRAPELDTGGPPTFSNADLHPAGVITLADAVTAEVKRPSAARDVAEMRDPDGEKEEKGSWWTDFSISPYTALRSDNITDGTVLGAGLDVGYAINHTVSLHTSLTTYERPGPGSPGADCQEKWGGFLVDEAAVLVRADLIRDSHERFVAFAIGGVHREMNRDDWGIGVGGGFEVRLAKNFSLFASTQVRAWFQGEAKKDLWTPLGASLRL